jgi:serine/threonine protein phosphatase PrpC
MPEGQENWQAGGAATPGNRALGSGDRVGSYVIVRLLATDAAGSTYLAHSAPNAAESGVSPGIGPQDPVCLLLQRPAGAYDDLRPMLALGLHHPRLLAPRAIVSAGADDFLVIDGLVGEDVAASAAGSSPALDAAGALAAGVGLSDALSYLHRNGVAHLRVSPMSITMHGGRAQLSGLEHAQLTHPLDPQAARLFSRDANFLARTLGVLAGVGEDASAAARADAFTTALAAIVARGAANGFATAEEVGAACSAALPGHDVDLPAAPLLPASGRLSLLVGTATSVGQVRSENQDVAASAVFEVCDDLCGGEGATLPAGVFLVADGMGGEARGELASRIAARTVLTETVQHLLLPVLRTPIDAAVAGLAGADTALPSLTDTLLRAGQAANARVRQLVSTLGRATGTTLTALAAIGTRAALVHVGDSRAYLLRAGKLMQLTQDHTLLARLQAIDHPLLHDPAFSVPRNYLYRSLGHEDVADLDTSDLTLAPGDRLLFCSDGLWDEVDGAKLLQCFAAATTPQECAESLVAAANAAGGHDNSTALVVFVGNSSPVLPPDSAVGTPTDAGESGRDA